MTGAERRARPFVHKNGITALFLVLIRNGDVCPKCLMATRYTSKNWARCDKCDVRVRRGGGD